MNLGEIWRHDAYYQEDEEDMRKYVVILAIAGGDVFVRTLTSRSNLRSKDVCSHDSTRPHYFLGVLNPAAGLGRDSWVDLHDAEGIDCKVWESLAKEGTITYVMSLPKAVMCPLLQCAIGAPDTTKNQAKLFYGSRATLGC